jgi:hypothetical protein
MHRRLEVRERRILQLLRATDGRRGVRRSDGLGDCTARRRRSCVQPPGVLACNSTDALAVCNDVDTGAPLTHATRWYDDQGRLIRTSQDGRTNRTYAYGAACPARVNAVRAPTAERRANIDLCIRSPGYAFDSCFYDVP